MPPLRRACGFARPDIEGNLEFHRLGFRMRKVQGHDTGVNRFERSLNAGLVTLVIDGHPEGGLLRRIEGHFDDQAVDSFSVLATVSTASLTPMTESMSVSTSMLSAMVFPALRYSAASRHHSLPADRVVTRGDGRGAVDRLLAFVEIHIVMPPARFRHLDKQGVSALLSSCPSLKQGLVRSSTQNRRSPSGGMKPKLNLWLLSSATKIGSSMSEAMQYQTIANSSGVILRMRKSEIETDRFAQDLRERRDLYRLVGGIAVGLSVSPLPIGMCNARE